MQSQTSLTTATTSLENGFHPVVKTDIGAAEVQSIQNLSTSRPSTMEAAANVVKVAIDTQHKLVHGCCYLSHELYNKYGACSFYVKKLTYLSIVSDFSCWVLSTKRAL